MSDKRTLPDRLWDLSASMPVTDIATRDLLHEAAAEIDELRKEVARLREQEMAWTDEPNDPAEGWFWVTDGKKSQIVELEWNPLYDEDDDLYAMELRCYIDGEWKFLGDMPGYRWAGPIPSPVEREVKR